jgi:outer membrane protein insertion porin family
MNLMKNFLIVTTIGSLLATSCSPTKHLGPNEKLYTGATVKVNGPSLGSRQKKVLRSDLQGLTRPEPNTRFLGIPVKLMIYNMFYNAKKGFFKSIRDKYGEPPVLMNQVDLDLNVRILRNYLVNKGYFNAQVQGDTTVKKKRGSATYHAETGDQYTIDTVHFPNDSSDLSMAISATSSETLLKEGAPFDLDVIKGERTRIDAILKEKGFYFFSPEYLLIKTDSTIGGHKVDMYMTIKPETPRQATRIYRIDDVYIYSNYSLNTAQTDTLLAYDTLYHGYHIIDKENKFKPYLFEETMQFKPGDVYNRTDHNRTLSRLINLNIFKFVKNRFEVVPTSDSALLDAYYYLTPKLPKSLRVELTTVTRSNNLNGTQLNLSWQHRNLFRSAAQANVSAYVGTDVQFSGAFKGYNTYRTGAQANFAIPRFVVPFVNLRQSGPFAPRTTIRLGYDILNRKKLYTINSYNAEYGYNWKRDIRTSQELYPVSISFAQPLNVTKTYDSLKRNILGLDHIIDTQFILGSRYEYLYNEQANGIQSLNAWYLNGILELSGNIAGLLTGANAKQGNRVNLFGLPFSQYFKVEGDIRYYRKIGLKSSWANRIDIGVGIPYGNSVEIPYIKQFFIGGNNSLRGFRSRSVGPGTYFPKTLSGDPSSIIPDQTGDIKLEMNTEFRPHISGPLYGAVFLEAGNIWLLNDSTYTQKAGAQFTGKFLNQLAVDAGVGIRLDITLFVIRLDVAFPLRKPWVVPPSVIRDINFTNPEWRKQNLVYNLAIGYPF